MWVSGIMEGLMWRAYNAQGFLEWSFVETVSAKHISYIVRSLGGMLFLSGTVIMAYNLRMTILGKGAAEDISPDLPLSTPQVQPAATNLQPAE